MSKKKAEPSKRGRGRPPKGESALTCPLNLRVDRQLYLALVAYQNQTGTEELSEAVRAVLDERMRAEGLL